MAVGGIPGPGPFRGLVAYDERSSALFFGRSRETAAALQQIARDGARVTALTGEAGVGKTSLLRAGLTPTLVRQGVLTLYLDSYEQLDQSLWQAASRAGAEPPTSGETAADYLVRISRTSRAGTLVMLDHLEAVVASPGPALGQLGAFLATAAAGAGPRLRFLLCIDGASFHKLDLLHTLTGFSPLPGTWMELPRLEEAQVIEILEQTALQTGTFFETGLAALIAGDLCRARPCLPADLQLVARTVIDLRLTSIRRYERSGGAELLVHTFLERVVTEAGGRPARRLLLEMALARDVDLSQDELVARTRLPRGKVERALAAFVARGLLAKREGDRTDRYTLAHASLIDRINDYAAVDAARTKEARRSLRRRVLAGTRLSVPELRAVRQRLGGALDKDEDAAVTRSLRRTAFHVGLALVVAVGLLFAVFFELRSSYHLAFDPGGDSPSARVVVRSGRPSLSFLYFLPSRPPFGSVIADTGFAATGMAQELAEKVTAGRATGTLEHDRSIAVPGWLRTVINGLRPVPRGVAMVLLGDANGISPIKQAFAEPASRPEALEALAVIGAARAGEDEILASALADPSPEIRRRAVEVAAAIDRRQGHGGHGNTLRAALADKDFEVRSAVLRECATLDPSNAASILSVALADKDPTSRRLAEKAIVDLAARAPAAAADAVRLALRSPDALARRNALGLLEQIAVRAPQEAAAALIQIAGEEKAPEETRVAALQVLRHSGVAPAKIQGLLEKAVSPESSPRLRAAALPLHVRLLDAAKAEEIAVAESKGSSATRATGAAVWGALASRQPEAAAKALKAFGMDPSPEVRIEAARSYGYLKRDGADLIRRALLDNNPEVQRAAIESAVTLAAVQPYAAPELLGKALTNVRPAVRKSIIEALGRIGQERPNVVIAPLAKALREGDPTTKAAAAGTFCLLAKKSAAAASPYLRIAARDTDREVRTAAASCLGSLAQGDPKGAARIATELASASEASVRAAAASSLGALAARASDLVLPPLVKLLQDPDHGVRVAAAEAIAAAGKAHVHLGKRSDEVEHALAGLLAQSDPADRLLAIRAAAQNNLQGLLRQAAADGDDGLRLAAVQAAAALNPPALDILQRAVEDRSGPVRAEAVRRLAGTSGEGAQRVLPIFETMLRSGDPASRRAGAAALGDLAGVTEQTTRILAATLRQTDESVRTAAAEALGHIAERDPDRATSILEKTLSDPAHDVRTAAIRGLGGVWSRRKSPAEIGAVLETSETDSARRLVALEALVLQAQDHKTAAAKELERVAQTGPPLARLAAQVGRAFVDSRPAPMHDFLEKLLGG
jgi:HEAT repeat protein/DNA-binding MarR family transcriptional regulator